MPIKRGCFTEGERRTEWQIDVLKIRGGTADSRHVERWRALYGWTWRHGGFEQERRLEEGLLRQLCSNLFLNSVWRQQLLAAFQRANQSGEFIIFFHGAQ